MSQFPKIGSDCRQVDFPIPKMEAIPILILHVGMIPKIFMVAPLIRIEM